MRNANEWPTEATWLALLVGLVLAGSAAACLLSTDASAGRMGHSLAVSATSSPAEAGLTAPAPAEVRLDNLDEVIGLDAAGTPILLP